jgi:hypothetical protein
MLKRRGALSGWSLAATGLAIAASALSIALLAMYWGQRSDLNRIRADLVRARAGQAEAAVALDRARSELEATRGQVAQTAKRLSRAEEEISQESATAKAAQAFIEEFARITGVRFPCHSPETTRIETAILSPAQGQIVKAPVLVHVIGSRPLLCDPTYYLSVDGVPYLQLAADETEPNSALNPFPTRPMRTRPATDACISAPYVYFVLKLPPGFHVLRVNGGCPQGTAVPATIPAEVSFRVGER